MNQLDVAASPAPRIITKCQHCGVRAENVCNAVDQDHLEELAALATVVKVAAGRGFIVEGDPATHFFNITSGTAKVFKLLHDGRRQITGFADAGHLLGIAVSSTYAFSAEAVTDLSICRFPRARLMAMMDENPAMNRRLLVEASNELVAAQEQMLLLGRKTARERLAAFLLARMRMTPCGVVARASLAQWVDLPMSRYDIADYLGLSVETVSRTMTRLKNERLIALPSQTRIAIPDLRALGALAEGLD